MAATRPYLLVLKGEKHIIEAPGAAHAVQHVVGADISELRPARAAEVTAWVREGKAIPIAGATIPAVAPQEPKAHETGFPFLVEQAFLVVCNMAGFNSDAPAPTVTADIATYRQIQSSGRMDLMTFDTLRGHLPDFGEAVAEGCGLDVAALRAQIEDEPLPYERLVNALARYVPA